MSLLEFENRISNLRLNTRGGNEKSPHKVALLLAVMDMIEAESIPRNRIFFNDELKRTFTRHFDQLASPADRNNPHLPFFHLRSSGFWHHYIKPGKQDSYHQLSSASGPGIINSHIEYAFLDDELFEYFCNDVSRNFLKSALLENLSTDSRRLLLDVGKSWNWIECEVTVQQYFDMLKKELSGESFNKAEYRRHLLPKLNNRSESSIEFKHQNISAILIEMGLPYIKGYKPATNYQQQLKEVVLAHLAGNKSAFDLIASNAEMDAIDITTGVDWNSVLDNDIPEHIPRIKEAPRQYLAKKVNYSERERKNRKLGESGEAFVMEFERFRLEQAGRPDLAKEVEWTSKVKGDGTGFDIRSFTPELDKELFIEVKTTKSGKYFPFYVSDGELAFSKSIPNQYSLYRVYNFGQSGRLFRLPGAIDQHVNLRAVNYLADFN